MEQRRRTREVAPQCDVRVEDRCGDLSAEGLGRVAELLRHAERALTAWRRWRRGASWEGPEQSSWVPSPARLDAEVTKFVAIPLGCASDGSRALPADDPQVFGHVEAGVRGLAGVERQRAGELEEWLSYAHWGHSVRHGARGDAIVGYFQLRPSPVAHTYTCHLDVGSGVELGIGLGTKLEWGNAKGILGCVVGGGFDVANVTYGYENDRGMAWSARYSRGRGKIGVECGVHLKLEGVIVGSPGNDICHDETTSSTWYGPHDFADVMLGAELSATWQSGVGAEMGTGIDQVGSELLATLVVEPRAKPVLHFYAEGICTSAAPAMGLTGGLSEYAGAQALASEPEVTPGKEPEPARDRREGPTHHHVRGALRVLARSSVYFDRGGSDPLVGDHAADNAAALRGLIDAAKAAADRGDPPELVQVELVGHASAVWDGARDEGQRVESNDALAARRAEQTRGALQGLYAALAATGWPEASFAVDSECADAPVVDAARAEGAAESMAETGDAGDASARFQRVDVVVRVPADVLRRRTVDVGGDESER